MSGSEDETEEGRSATSSTSTSLASAREEADRLTAAAWKAQVRLGLWLAVLALALLGFYLLILWLLSGSSVGSNVEIQQAGVPWTDFHRWLDVVSELAYRS